MDSPETGFFIPYPNIPDVTVEKYTNGLNVIEPPGPLIIVGQPVEWSYNVTNTGKANLTNIVVVDDQGWIVELPMTDLQPGESTVGTAYGVAVAGQYKLTLETTLEICSIDAVSLFFESPESIA